VNLTPRPRCRCRKWTRPQPSSWSQPPLNSRLFEKTMCPPASPALRGGGKPSFSIALISATRRRIPACASTNQGPGQGDLVPLAGLVVPLLPPLAAHPSLLSPNPPNPSLHRKQVTSPPNSLPPAPNPEPRTPQPESQTPVPCPLTPTSKPVPLRPTS
jgi:hypothetical protein